MIEIKYNQDLVPMQFSTKNKDGIAVITTLVSIEMQSCYTHISRLANFYKNTKVFTMVKERSHQFFKDKS